MRCATPKPKPEIPVSALAIIAWLPFGKKRRIGATVLSSMGGFMPIILGVYHDRKEVDAIAIGPIHHSDAENHLLTERHFEGLAYKEFIDARCAGILLTSAEIRQIVAQIRSLGQQSKLGPTAGFVPTDVAFGLMRLLEALVADVCEVRPFREEQEATAWLATKSTGP